jgi:hypothetical protein
MTPFEIEMLIHYHCSDAPYRNLETPAGKAAADKLVSAGILYYSESEEAYCRVSGAMDLYIQAICDVPLPKKIWIMPDTKNNHQ